MSRTVNKTESRRPERGRALFYTRDSGGQHEMTPGEYVEWARRTCADLRVTFAGTPQQIRRMIETHQFADGDLFLDFDVKGNVLSRAGLNALFAEIRRDLQITHVLIPRPDRLARPDEITEGLELEHRLRKELGVTLVFQGRTGQPIARGQKLQISDLITSAVDYDAAEQFRTELAGKTLNAQAALAKQGFSTGGRASYGLQRWLVREDGTPLRLLEDGENVRTRGQHVRWLPGPPEKWKTRCRILRMLKAMPASQVARTLTEEGIPSPNAGKTREDGGVLHAVSGTWTQNTVNNIARDPRNIALQGYGRRSMGDRLRYSPAGPRQLEDRDFDAKNKPRVIENPASERLRASKNTP